MFKLIKSEERICNENCNLYSTPCTLVINAYSSEDAHYESVHRKRQDNGITIVQSLDCFGYHSIKD